MREPPGYRRLAPFYGNATRHLCTSHMSMMQMSMMQTWAAP